MNKLQYFYITILGIYYLLDYTAPKGMPFWRPAYGLLLLISTLIFMLEIIYRKRRRDLNRASLLALSVWFALFIYWTSIPSIMALMGRGMGEPLYITYFLGDLAQIGMLFIGMGLGILWFGPFQIEALNAYLLTAALMAPMVANRLWDLQYHWTGRFDPPHVLLISASAVGVLCASKSRRRLFWLTVSLGTTLLAALSGMRTILFLALLSLIFAATLLLEKFLRAAIRNRQKVINLIILAAFVLASIAALALLGNALLDSNNRSFVLVRDSIVANVLLRKSRMTRLLNDGIEGDESLMGRMLEVLDVANQVLEDCSMGRIERCLLGRGHGATFEAEVSHPGPNITPDGRVHNIHFGPALLAFRYGVFGLLGYISLLLLAMHNLYSFAQHCTRICTRRLAAEEQRRLFISGASALALTLIVINFTMRTILVDPLTGLIVGLNLGRFIQENGTRTKRFDANTRGFF